MTLSWFGDCSLFKVITSLFKAVVIYDVLNLFRNTILGKLKQNTFTARNMFKGIVLLHFKFSALIQLYSQISQIMSKCVNDHSYIK